MRVSHCHDYLKAKAPGYCIFALILLAVCPAQAGEKRILLRNEVIVTGGPERQSIRAQADQKPASGLFLIQFEDELPADWKEQLSRLNVKLLRAVPQDAYVGRFANTSMEQVVGLPFVRYVGPYKPEHKTL